MIKNKLVLMAAIAIFLSPFAAGAVAVTWDFSNTVLKPLAAVLGSRTSIGTTTATTNATLTVSATSTDTTTVLSLLKSTGAGIFSALASGNVGVGSTTPYSLLSIGGNVVVGASTAGGTLGDLYLPKLGTAAGTFIAVDATGKVIATTTSAGGVTSVTGTYPVVSSGGATPAISLDFGTTTSNTWAGTQTIGALTVTGNTTLATALSGILGLNAGITYAVSTSTLNIGGNAATVTTNANLTGVVTSSGNATSWGSATAGVLGTSVTGIPTFMATSTLYGAGGIPNSALANSTISGISLGGTLAALTNDATLSGSSYNGSAAISDWGLNLGNANNWTALQTFTLASSTQFTAGTNTLYIDSAGRVQAKDTTNSWSGVVSPTRAFVLGTGTTTTWLASTTGSAYSPSMIMPFAGTLRQARCSGWFLGTNVKINGTSVTPSYFISSTTVGVEKFTAGNTFTAGQTVSVDFGTTTSSIATTTSCTFEVTETY